jgi:protein SCO1/2
MKTLISMLRPLTLLTLFVAGVAAGCSTRSEPRSCCPPPPAASPAQPLADRSLFQLDSTWTDDRRTELKLASLGGRPIVIAMFFARCEYACPVLVHDMKKLQAALPAALRGRIGLVLVSFDSERDTPGALAEYRRIHELPENWSLLRGATDDVLELAALLGVKFKQDARGQFAHSNLLTVLDAGGEIVHQQVGLNQSPDESVKHLLKLLRP